jgi:hypothetical protein
MIQLFQDPGAAANIQSTSHTITGMPKPRDVAMASKSTMIEGAAILVVVFLIATSVLEQVGSSRKNLVDWLFPLLIVLSVSLFVFTEMFRELRNRPLLVKGECSSGKVISQRWVRSGRRKSNEIAYEFQVGGVMPMKGHGTDWTNQYCVNMPVLVFYDPDDISRNVAICCTRWRIRTREGILIEP